MSSRRIRNDAFDILKHRVERNVNIRDKEKDVFDAQTKEIIQQRITEDLILSTAFYRRDIITFDQYKQVFTIGGMQCPIDFQ